MNNVSHNFVTCPRCFSKNIYKFSKDKNSFQRYKCKDCSRQFTLEKTISHRKRLYPPCPICNHASFIWHRYTSYIHFKCGNKKCNHSFKLPTRISYKNNDFLLHTISLKHFRFPPNVILFALSCYFDTSSSTRAIKKLIKNFFHFTVSHVSIHYWTKLFAPYFRKLSFSFIPKLDLASCEWHADETYIKINNVRYYLWLLLDSETRFIISFHLSSSRDSSQAFILFSKAINLTSNYPDIVVTDKLDSYNFPISYLLPHTKHYTYQGFTDPLNNNRIESFNKTFKSWYKTKKCFKNFNSAFDLIETFIFNYNFLREHSSLNNLQPAIVAGAKYSQNDICNWFLF